MVLKRLAYEMGWTAEKKQETSEMRHEKAVVTDKSFNDEYADFTVGAALGDPNIAIRRDAEYIVKLKGDVTSFRRNDKKLFDELKVGDEVMVGYAEVYDVVVDYIPPNFDIKQVIERSLRSYRFVDAKKL